MRITLLAIFLCIFLDLSGQSEKWTTGKGFNSSFQKMTNGHFDGFVDGIIQFIYNDGSKSTVSFSHDSASLDIVPDKFKIYDVSYKNYKLKTSGLQIDYKTYNASNALFLTTPRKKYKLNFIDGVCMQVIKGLDYDYILKDNEEILILHFSSDVNMDDTPAEQDNAFYVSKGSTLIIHIKR
jgi:hypothetical protein